VSESTYSSEYRIFLQQLRAAREKSQLSQRELAERLNKSYSYVAKLETGYSRMDIYQIRLYLRAVGMPFLEFMQEYEAALQRAGAE
jgi:transcriptional regulator with XRE-family HTH domain